MLRSLSEENQSEKQSSSMLPVSGPVLSIVSHPHLQSVYQAGTRTKFQWSEDWLLRRIEIRRWTEEPMLGSSIEHNHQSNNAIIVSYKAHETYCLLCKGT